MPELEGTEKGAVKDAEKEESVSKKIKEKAKTARPKKAKTSREEGGSCYMKLVIAEKPSVAQSLAKVIGANQKKMATWKAMVILSAGAWRHLIELANPEHYDEKYKKWRRKIYDFPAPFSYQVTASHEKQYQVLKDLMKRSDVESLVEATDAGREGELIFRLVYKQAGCKKPFERLWISSMEEIKQSRKALRI